MSVACTTSLTDNAVHMRIFQMTKIISVIQLKGGAGKSTVATNLAAMLAERGRTLLIDADSPQYTSECWYVLRRK